MKTKLILAFLLLCMTLSLCLAASAETVAYIAHNGGAAANDGLSDATPKNGLGGVSGTACQGAFGRRRACR